MSAGGGRERRAHIVELLRAATDPLSGTALARELGVSRQVVVQDIALLRADGRDIVATSRGYVLRAGDATDVPTRLIKVRHTLDEMEDELTCIVDGGGVVLNVMVNHRVYHMISADLNIRSRRDVARFLGELRSSKSQPLMMVTSGYHFHRIMADSEAALDDIEAALARRGYLAEVLPYEQDLEGPAA